jgi:hypothetical protein
MFYMTIIFATFATAAMAQTIPSELWGRWVIRRELPTSTITCWGETEAREIIGTEIEYSADSSGGRTRLRSIRLLTYRSSLRSNSTTRIQAEAQTVLR